MYIYLYKVNIYIYIYICIYIYIGALVEHDLRVTYEYVFIKESWEMTSVIVQTPISLSSAR